jgi:hypothetical protein
MLLETTDDLRLDIPDAADQLMLFLARAMVDELLPPFAFTDLRDELRITAPIGSQVEHAALSLPSPRVNLHRLCRPLRSVPLPRRLSPRLLFLIPRLPFTLSPHEMIGAGGGSGTQPAACAPLH